MSLPPPQADLTYSQWSEIEIRQRTAFSSLSESQARERIQSYQLVGWRLEQLASLFDVDLAVIYRLADQS